MGDKQFWDILAVANRHPIDSRPWHEALSAELAKLDLDELVRWDRHFDERTDRAYRRDLWSVAEIMNGGASDDGFYYFCCWLVGMGKQVYEAALANPDSLADVPIQTPDGEAEAEIYSVAPRSWRARGGTDEEYDRARDRLPKMRRVKLTGKDLDFYDPEVRKRFPRLTAAYGLDREFIDEDED
jgi:hypothetical protein